MNEKQVKEAIMIILSDKNSRLTSLSYAVGYCREALHMQGHELQIQCSYILANITHWRHPQAKDVRVILKAFKG